MKRTPQQQVIMDRMTPGALCGAGFLGRPVVIDDHLSAVFGEAMGRIPCPWGGCGLFAKGEVVLSDSRTGATLRLTPLSVHFVAAHGFYQGRGSPYRLEPARLVEVLDIPAGPG